MNPLPFFKSLDKQLAWRTTQTLFIVIGGTGSVAFAATLQWWLALSGLGFLTLTWVMIYKLQLGILQLKGQTNER